jgi:hypothetical protein
MVHGLPVQLIELFSSSLLKPIQMDVDVHEPATL